MFCRTTLSDAVTNRDRRAQGSVQIILFWWAEEWAETSCLGGISDALPVSIEREV